MANDQRRGKVITLEITSSAGIQMLHSDDFDMGVFGKFSVVRASHVEFNNKTGLWFVRSAKTRKLLRSNFKTREAALSWERQHFSPGGKGWKELVGR